MYLIANSGFTKCNWVLLDKTGKFIFKTQTLDINPSMLTTQMMRKRLAKSEEIAHVKDDIKEIYFYGKNSCDTHKDKIRLERFLAKYFRQATSEINENILGACLVVTNKPGIVCILNTGANACYFNGKTVETCTPSLGYMVMDEASGNYFGKQLLADYFYKKMPSGLSRKFEMEFDLNPQTVKTNLYKKEKANAYLANFAQYFFRKNPLPSYFRSMVSEGLNVFIENQVLRFPEAQSVPIHFVGPVAYYSKDIIAEVLKERKMSLGKIIQHPIDGLVDYYQKRIGV